MDLNDIYNIIYKKIDNINNIESITLLCENTIINENNINDYKDKNIYLFINKNKNKNMIKDSFLEIRELIKNIFSSNYVEEIDYTYNLNILIEMGYEEEESYNALELNNNDILESINYLLDN